MTTPTITDVIPLPADLDALPPPDPFYYVATKDKFLVHKQTMFGKVLVPVSEIPHLEEHGPMLWYDIPKVPATLINQVWSFFNAVWERRKTEAMVYLTWRNGEYRVFVPDQHPTGGHVTVENMDARKLQRGWRIAGTIHSHCNFGAFHSGTDKNDAAKHDGIHMTMGHVDDPTKFDIAIMVSINGINWDFKIPDAIEGEIGPSSHPGWWHRHMLEDRPAPTHDYKSGWTPTKVVPSHTPTHPTTIITSPRQLTLPDGKGTQPDPFLPSTPLKSIVSEDLWDIQKVLVARGYAVQQVWPISGLDTTLTVEEWDEALQEAHDRLLFAITDLGDLGIDTNLTFGVDTDNLIRSTTQETKK